MSELADSSQIDPSDNTPQQQTQSKKIFLDPEHLPPLPSNPTDSGSEHTFSFNDTNTTLDGDTNAGLDGKTIASSDGETNNASDGIPIAFPDGDTNALFVDGLFVNDDSEQVNQKSDRQGPTSSPQDSAVQANKGAESAHTFPEWGEGANTTINRQSASSDSEYILKMGQCRRYLEHQNSHGYKYFINIFSCSYMTNTLGFPIDAAFVANLRFLVSTLQIHIIDLRGAPLEPLDGNRLFAEIINISIEQKTSQFQPGNLRSIYIDENIINFMSYGRENGNMFYIPWKHVFSATHTPPGNYPILANNISLHIFKNGQELPAQGENQIVQMTATQQRQRPVTNYNFTNQNPIQTGSYKSIEKNASRTTSKRPRQTETQHVFFI